MIISLYLFMSTCASSNLKRNETVRPTNIALPQLGFLCFQPRMLDNEGNSKKSYRASASPWEQLWSFLSVTLLLSYRRDARISGG